MVSQPHVCAPRLLGMQVLQLPGLGLGRVQRIRKGMKRERRDRAVGGESVYCAYNNSIS